MYALGDIDAAVDCAKNAVAVASENAMESCNVLCRFLRDAGRVEEADKIIRNELERDPRSEWATRQLAYVLNAKGDFSGAEQAFERGVAINPYWSAGWFASSKMHQSNGRMDKALEHARRAAHAARENSDYSAHLCALLFDQKMYDEAESFARSSVALFPFWGYMHVALSTIHEMRGETDSALLEARKAVDASPETMEFREYLLTALIRHGHVDSAQQEALENIAKFPDQAWPLLQLSMLCEAQGDAGRGLEHARKTYALQPEKRALAANMARLLRQTGNYDEFEDFCQKAIDRDPNQGWAWRERCRMADARGDRKSALELGAKAIAVHPGDSEFRQYYDALVSGVRGA